MYKKPNKKNMCKKLFLRFGQIIVLVLAFLLITPAFSFAQSGVNLEVKGAPLKTVMESISKQSSYRFVYTNEVNVDSYRVTVTSKNEPATTLFDKIFKPLNIHYRIKGSQVVLGITSAVAETTEENQQRKNLISVKGTVKDAATGEAIPYASVFVKGTALGAYTADDGSYNIPKVPANGTLTFNYVGYKTQAISVNSRAIINVQLASEAVNLDDVLVVAYGTAKKESFTGSAEVVKSDKLQKRTVSNVTKAIDGMVTGVQSTSGSGQPGAGASIIIRGFGSINAARDPLYVVDGIPYDGNINSINPSDIESMTILKDASAGALYGSRGANGVVMITTKKGTNGDLSVEFKGSWGVSSRAIPMHSTLNAYGYVESIYNSYRGEQIRNGVSPADAGQAAITEMVSGSTKIFGTNAMYNPFDCNATEIIDLSTGKVKSGAKLKWNESWMDAVTQDNPLRQDYVLTLSGGSDKTKYMFSLGYLDEKGMVVTTDFNRYSGRANIDSQVKDWLKTGINMNVAKSNAVTTSLGSGDGSSSTASSNVFHASFLMAPIYPVYEKDANGQTVYENGSAVYDYGVSRPSGASPNWSSIGALYNDRYRFGVESVSGRTYIDLGGLKEGPLKGFKFTTTFGFDYKNSRYDYYYNPYTGNAVETKGKIEVDTYKTFSYTFNQLLNYNRTFGEKHNLDVLVGHEYYSYKNNYFGGSKTGLPFGGMYELSAASTLYSLDGYEDNYGIESVLSRLNYNYDNKYYFSASYRRDASSRFEKSKRWGDFWSVGASWRISEEKFMKDIKWINNLTAKISYGVQGNDNIGTYYAWQSFYSLNFPNGALSGALISSLENKDLKWEKNGNLNIGLEGKFLDNRIQASAEWYSRKTSDMLMDYPMATSLGFSSFNKNVGSMRNRGLEFAITGTVMRTDNLEWNVNLQASTINNKVLGLADKDEIISGNYIIKTGETLNSFYVSKSAGVDPATGDKLYWVWDTDANGNKGKEYISNSYSKAVSCRHIAGSRIPKVYGSISSDFRYKNFDASVMTTYSKGGKIYDGVYQAIMYPFYSGVTAASNRAKAWKNPGDITDIPRIDIAGNYATTEDDLFDASYFAIKNIAVGYTLPKKWTSKARMSSVRLSLTADNLWVFTALKGMDPQTNFTGSTGYTYSAARTISFGLDIKF